TTLPPSGCAASACIGAVLRSVSREKSSSALAGFYRALQVIDHALEAAQEVLEELHGAIDFRVVRQFQLFLLVAAGKLGFEPRNPIAQAGNFFFGGGALG